MKEQQPQDHKATARAIEGALSLKARDFWNGRTDEEKQTSVQEAYNHGLASAIQSVEDAATVEAKVSMDL